MGSSIKALFKTPRLMLVPEAVIANLAKPRRQLRSRAVAYLSGLVASHLIYAIKNNTKLGHFYEVLMSDANSDEKISILSIQQRHVIVDACLRSWLVELESAISFWQHSNLPTDNRKKKHTNRFIFCSGEEIFVLTLEEISRITRFLYKELCLPTWEQKSRPAYQGPAPSRHCK